MQTALDAYYYCQTLELKNSANTCSSALCLLSIPLPELKSHAQTFLHPKERAYFETLKFERRQLSYLLGTLAAKLVIHHFEINAAFTDIFIETGVFGFPVVNYPDYKKVQISISHSGQACIALAFPEAFPMSIDLETIDAEKNSVIETQITEDEKQLINSLQPVSQAQLYAIIWTIKEALSKVLRTGLTTPFEIYAIKQINLQGKYWIAEFKNFSQYQVLSFQLENFMCSIVYPKGMQMQIDIPAIQQWLVRQPNL